MNPTGDLSLFVAERPSCTHHYWDWTAIPRYSGSLCGFCFDIGSEELVLVTNKWGREASENVQVPRSGIPKRGRRADHELLGIGGR